MEPDVRDQVVDFIRYWADRMEWSALGLVDWMQLGRSKYYDWRERYGKVNEHNAWLPRDHWIEPWERSAILDFHQQYPLEGYRRLTYMMLGRDLVAISPATTYRTLKAAGLLADRWSKPTRKGAGIGSFAPP